MIFADFDLNMLTVTTFAILFVAYMVRGITGFGSGLISIPLLALNYPLAVVVPIVVLFDYMSSAAQGLSNHRAVNWKVLFPLMPFTLAGVLLGLYFFKNIDQSMLNIVLGIFVIAFALYQILPLPQMKGSALYAIPSGILGGLIGTLFGTGGPFYMIYLSLRQLDKTAVRASFAIWFLIDGSVRLIGYLSTGLLSFESMSNYVHWVIPVVLGQFVGSKIHTGISNQTFKYLISLLLVYSGYNLITQ